MNKQEQFDYINEHFPYECGRLSNRRVRQTFFSKIDTELQAYLLGFHAADGCVDDSRNTFRVQLQESDSELIYLFKDNIAPDARVFTIQPRELICNRTGKKYISEAMFGVNIYCAHITDDLTKLGFGSNKTFLELHLPKIDDSLIRHFIRGYFDGDGSVIGTAIAPDPKHRKINWTFRTKAVFTSKTKSLLEEIQIWLKNNNITKSSICLTGRDCYVLSIPTSQMQKLFKLFYEDSNFYLKRKYEKFNHFVNTEVTQLIAEYRNAQKVSVSDSNNPSTSAEHPIGVKMCAELTGNCENSEIKNSEDNIIEVSLRS